MTYEGVGERVKVDGLRVVSLPLGVGPGVGCVGASVGLCVGSLVGLCVGSFVGFSVSHLAVGVGLAVGTAVASLSFVGKPTARHPPTPPHNHTL